MQTVKIKDILTLEIFLYAFLKCLVRVVKVFELQLLLQKKMLPIFCNIVNIFFRLPVV